MSLHSSQCKHLLQVCRLRPPQASRQRPDVSSFHPDWRHHRGDLGGSNWDISSSSSSARGI